MVGHTRSSIRRTKRKRVTGAYRRIAGCCRNRWCRVDPDMHSSAVYTTIPVNINMVNTRVNHRHCTNCRILQRGCKSVRAGPAKCFPRRIRVCEQVECCLRTDRRIAGSYNHRPWPDGHMRRCSITNTTYGLYHIYYSCIGPC